MKKGEVANICVAATFTSEPINEFLQGFLAPFEPQVNFAPYNQLFAQLLDPSSTLRINTSASTLLLIRPEDWLRYSEEKKDLGSICDEFIQALVQFIENSASVTLVALCPSVSESPENATQLAKHLNELSNVHFLDLRDLFEKYQIDDAFDREGDEIGHIPYKKLAFIALAYEVSRAFFMHLFPARKVIALDCDNTLWTGVVGEDGATGVKIREDVTRFMVDQMHQGKLLTIASKNEAHDAWSVFEQHPQMSLSKDMIVHAEINWEPKSGNLINTANMLNVGVDSFIFVDDNPVECAEVALALSGVVTFNIPKSDQNISKILSHHWAFDQLKITSEDRKRTEMMRQNIQRNQHSESCADYDAFLASINLEIKTAPIEHADIERASQLTQRTNQFNSTTIRRSETDLSQIISSGGFVHKTTVSDKFGSYGFVGLTISYPKDNCLFCDSFLLSCRVLGKRVENRMVLAVLESAISQGLTEVVFSYEKSDRNTPLLKFYQSLNGSNLTENKAELHFNVQELKTLVDSLSVDYGDIGSSKQKKSSDRTDIKSDKADYSTHMQGIALCGGDILLLENWITQKRQKNRVSEVDFAEPISETETKLVEIWRDVLLLNKVGVNDAFFSVGGDSLAAARVLVSINREFGVKHPMSIFYERSTIRELANYIDGIGDNSVSYKHAVRMTSESISSPKLFWVSGMFGQLFNLRHFVSHFEGYATCYGLQAKGVDDGLKPFETINDMVDAYFQEICEIQPEGEYLLFGYCSGGIIVQELARRLLLQGKNVKLVVMVDTRLPDEYYPPFTKQDSQYAHKMKLKTQGFSYFAKWLSARVSWELRKLKQRFTGKDMRITKNDLRAWHVADAYMCAIKEFEIKPVSFPVKLYKAKDELFVTLEDGRQYNTAKEYILEDNGWGEFISNLTTTYIPGDHDSMLEEPHVIQLVDNIKRDINS